MRRLSLLILMLAAVVWAGTATAGSIDLTVISDPVPSPTTIFVPSDTITIEVSINGEGLKINNYFFTITWSDSFSLTGIDTGSQWMPNFGYSEYWAHLSGNLAVDAYGLELNGYDPGGKCNSQTFLDEVLATLIFHVIEPGGPASITAGFGLGDGVFDNYYTAIPGFGLGSVTINVPEPATLSLVGFGILGIAYARRRR
jgi:hypothetical protein